MIFGALSFTLCSCFLSIEMDGEERVIQPSYTLLPRQSSLSEGRCISRLLNPYCHGEWDDSHLGKLRISNKFKIMITEMDFQ